MWEWILGLPLIAKIIIVALALGILGTIFKRFIKLAIYLAAFIILIIVILKLLGYMS